MDSLDKDFDAPQVSRNHELADAKDAVDYLDETWYSQTTRHGRLMDLIGDYAGKEPFIIDGDSLVQAVLDDPLLALGKPEDASFQLLHAMHLLETTIQKFLERNAVFDIVFWEENRHSALRTGSDDYVCASRFLAHALLKNHLANVPVDVFTFKSLADPEWHAYFKRTRPMFVMLDDGGSLDGDRGPLAAERILLRRNFLFLLMTASIAVSVLPGTEFRDSRISSFVYTQKLDPRAMAQHTAALAEILKGARDALQSAATAYIVPVPQNARVAAPDGVLAAAARAYLSPSAPAFHAECLHAFVAHCAVLQTLGVEARARAPEPLGAALQPVVVDGFLRRMFAVLGALVRESGQDVDVDGRVFSCLLHFLLRHPAAKLDAAIGAEAASRVDRIWSSLEGAPSVDYEAFARACPPGVPHVAPQVGRRAEYTLLPFTHPVLDETLISIEVEEEDHDDTGDDDGAFLHFGADIPFVDTQHWHNTAKPLLPKWLGGQSPERIAAWVNQRRLKRIQTDMKNIHRLAETLSGAQGAMLQQIVIPPVKGIKPAAPRTVAVQQPKSKKAESKKKLTSAEKIIAEKRRKDEEKQDGANQDWWREQLAGLGKLGLDAQKARVELLFRNQRSKQGWVAVEMRLFRLHLEISEWLARPDVKDAEVRDRYAVAVMRMVVELYRRPALWPKALAVLESVFVSLGFEEYAPAMAEAAQVSGTDRELGFSFVKLLKSKTKSPVHKAMRIKEDPAVWQLRVFGEFMDRSMDSAPDPRVPFEPDAWQRQVLDCLDDNQSILVVAPTSAGKTFISYYAMEQVLRRSDEGMLVFVAPTKALVNQVAADIYARFRKELGDRSCWAVHTRDYRIHDPQKCQVLVTVPEVLATMLLSPAQAGSWTPRIQRIILDEIHSIGQEEGGAVWEQILLLAPCPIVGLSATIGEPEVFNAWLESVQKAHNFKHAFIHHPTRYSHLRKFTYHLALPPAEPKFRGLHVYKPSNRLRFLHPVAMLGFGARSIPSDFSLEARDTLTLYEALIACRDVVPGVVDLDSLHPSKFLPKSTFIRQSDVLRYEAELKRVLSALLENFDPNDPDAPLLRVVRQLEDPELARTAEEPTARLNSPSEGKNFLENFVHLISELHTTGDLPAIVFNFDRNHCEILASALVNALEEAEEAWRKTSPEWTTKIRQYEVWQARAKERERQAERLAKAKSKSKGDGENAEAPESTSWESSFDPDDPSPEFTFAGNNRTYSFNTLKSDIEDMSWGNSIPEWAIAALRRGIAVHHAGMNKRYRNLVESLFRLGFVRVMIATGTLALGINAPARTSIFCDDSPFLTALMYRQCAGRAGRRGYDLLGKVIFYGLPMDRIQRLVLSKLPSIGGHFPLTSTLCLRLLNLLSGSNNAPIAVKSVQSLLSLPQITVGSDVHHEQILHHFRFSIDYLRRAGLIHRDGSPVNLYSIVAHLYYTEPSNFAIVTLFRRGVFHRISSDPSTEEAKRQFMLIMCHLFQRRYLPQSFATDRQLAALRKKWPSVIKLPPLSEDVRAVLADHDGDILRIFEGYALTFAEQHAGKLVPDQELPLSKRRFTAEDTSSSVPSFVAELRASAVRVVARSPFVANSGHGDAFGSIAELTGTARRGLHLNGDAIPSMERFTDTQRALNAHIYDFYVHGQGDALVGANGVRRGDLWYLLEDFDMTLVIVKGALEQLLSAATRESGTDDVVVEGSTGVLDPADADADDGEDEVGTMKKPAGVSQTDWRVYEVFNAVREEFHAKFKAIWA